MVQAFATSDDQSFLEARDSLKNLLEELKKFSTKTILKEDSDNSFFKRRFEKKDEIHLASIDVITKLFSSDVETMSREYLIMRTQLGLIKSLMSTLGMIFNVSLFNLETNLLFMIEPEQDYALKVVNFKKFLKVLSNEENFIEVKKIKLQAINKINGGAK